MPAHSDSRPDRSAASAALTSTSFRHDINGLRAWAVVAVVLFHFRVPGFGGGFVGVDVFFVISGFLMTRIVVEGLAGDAGTRRFTFIGFYVARAVRIVPALTVLCATLVVIGSVVLPNDEFRILCRHALRSLFFVSNVQYWREAGYFDTTSFEKWLLHTWSLSVEWQFYLALPVALVTAWRWRPTMRTLATATAGAAMASWVLCVALTRSNASAAFYLMPTRSWEMLVGGLVYFASRRRGIAPRWRAASEAAGFALILTSIALFSAQTPWPGWRASIPVFGAALVLLAARDRSWWTASRFAQMLGVDSYSIYLWHWPIVVTIAYFDVQRDPRAIAAGLIATALAGRLSLVHVESPARVVLSRLSAPKRAFALTVVTASAVLVTAGIVAPSLVRPSGETTTDHALTMAKSSNGWCFRDVEDLDKLAITDRKTPCLLGDGTSAVVGLLIGDSHAGHYEPFWDRVGTDAGVAIESVSTNWCYPSTDDAVPPEIGERSYQQCMIDRAYFRDRIDRYDFVVLAGLWRAMVARGEERGFYDAIAQASARSRLVIVMASPPEFDSNLLAQYRRRIKVGLPFDVRRFDKTIDLQTLEANETIRAATRPFANVVFVDRDAMFTVGGARSDVTADNIPFNVDSGHISIYGSREAAKSFITSRLYVERVRPALEAMLIAKTQSADSGLRRDR